MGCDTVTDATPGTDEFELGKGAVLYNDRYDSREGRDLWHVVGRFVDVDTGARVYELWDGTHTRQSYYHAEDVFEDFVPAGWQMRASGKPKYHLTRVVGAGSKTPKKEFDDYFTEA